MVHKLSQGGAWEPTRNKEINYQCRSGAKNIVLRLAGAMVAVAHHSVSSLRISRTGGDMVIMVQTSRRGQGKLQAVVIDR